MTTTIREFQRNFPQIRARARAGEEIVIADADGIRYTFKARRKKTRTFGEAAAAIIGSFDSGLGDLATHPKHLAGLGRD